MCVCFSDMVVSGLHGTNDELHAGVIASMSLHVRSLAEEFSIRHMPNSKLQLKIGMHTGIWWKIH